MEDLVVASQVGHAEAVPEVRPEAAHRISAEAGRAEALESVEAHSGGRANEGGRGIEAVGGSIASTPRHRVHWQQ